MSVFYANVNNIRDDDTWRILLIFANRAVADEWWHAISTDSNSLLATNVQRISPEFYTHDPSKCNIFDFFTDSRFKYIADKFRGRLFLSLENDRGGRGIGILPDQTDPASGSEGYTSSQSPEPEVIMDGRGENDHLTTPLTIVSSPILPTEHLTSFPTVAQSLGSSKPGAVQKTATKPSTSLLPVNQSLGSAESKPRIVQKTSTEPSPLTRPVAQSRQMLAAIIMPHGPNSPEVYSKYVVTIKYATPDGRDLTIALLVNADIAVPRFKSRGATNDATSECSLTVEFQDSEDLNGSAKFGGAIGRSWIQFVTDKQVNIYGPIEGGPKENQLFVGMGSWITS